MKLASLKSGRDGRLVVVSHDLRYYLDASSIAPTLQAALDDWDRCEPELRTLAGPVETDTVGRHDFLLTPCSEATFRHFYPEHPVHRGCFGNLAEALAPYGIEPDAIPTAFNLFMNVPVAGDGKLRVDPPVSKAGDSIALRAVMDCVIGLTACSAYASNGGSLKPIHYRID